MHPAIKEFWIKTGHSLVGGDSIMDIWSIYIDLGMNMFRIEVVCHGSKYRFNEEWYSEKHMLKIIQLKAFI
jgi:hypothetical protein